MHVVPAVKYTWRRPSIQRPYRCGRLITMQADTPIIECIPNFSEGRDPHIIGRIVQAIAAVDGVRVLDTASDADHNRTVVTFVGPADGVLQAAFKGVRVASQLIDLNTHEGQHPRIGAADVVPLVPLSAVTMAQCVALSHRLARRIGDELGLPVYLYEHSATRPERRNLADLRRGGYEALIERIAQPQWLPDAGPAQAGPAGAVVVGARNPLIAFNVYLNTDDVLIAKQIARRIRQSSGGMIGVRALGLLVRGKAQVSMNIVDVEAAPLHVVVQRIAQEAATLDTRIDHSEVIGLLPLQTLLQSAAVSLHLPRIDRAQVLDWALHEPPITNA